MIKLNSLIILKEKPEDYHGIKPFVWKKMISKIWKVVKIEDLFANIQIYKIQHQRDTWYIKKTSILKVIK